MTAVFERILEMSGMAAVVIAVVLLIRLCLRKAPRKYSYALWSVAAFRLVCPVSFKAFFSLFRFVRTVEETQVVQKNTSPVPTVSPGYFDSVPPGYTPSVDVDFDPDYAFTYPVNTPPAAETPAAVPIDWLQVAAIVWLVGLAALLIYGIVSYVRLRRRMDTAVLAGENVWHSDRVQSPFILGFVRPKIYLPFGLTADQQGYVLAHERYHLKRFDHIVRPLSFLILAVHWFNPLVWLAYYLMSRDMEMSCDEKVLSAGDNIRKAYSTTLLSFAANRRFPSPSPLAFGESGVKGRIKNALNWKKPRTWVTVIAIVVCIVVILVCAADPAAHPHDWTENLTMEDVDWAELTVNGDDQNSRRLLDYEVRELVELLNGLKRGEMEQPPRQSAWAFPTERMVTICCGGIKYKLNLGSDPMTIICKDERVDWKGEDTWFVDSDALKDFIRQLSGQDSAEPAEPDDGYYQSVENIYLTPLSSALATADSGYYYLLQGDELRLINKHSGAAYSHTADGEWQELSEEVLHKMEWGTVTIGETDLWDTLRERQPMIRLYGNDSGGGNAKFLLNFGDELWVGDYGYDSNGYIHVVSVYRLDNAGEMIVVNRYGYPIGLRYAPYESAECLYLNPASSASPKSDNGEVWYIGTDRVTIYKTSNENDPIADFTDLSEWWVITAEEWTSMMLGVQALDISSYDTVMFCKLSERYGVLYADGDLWAVNLQTDYVWSVYRMEPREGNSTLSEETLAVRQADLTHDGLDETITVSRRVDEYGVVYYGLDICTANEKSVWSVELNSWEKGGNGYYLYERDGKYYLLEWFPHAQQSWYNFAYKIYRLSETAEPEIIEEDSLVYDLGPNYHEKMLTVDTEPLRAFEKKINALLQDAQALLVVGQGSVTVGDPDKPVWHAWRSPANEWEQQKQQSYARFPVVHTADLTHDGVDEIITLTHDEDVELYILTVTNAAGETLWRGEAATIHAGEAGFYLYQRDGKHYLMQWNPYGSTGGYWYHYEVFSLTEKGGKVPLVSNTMEFVVINEVDLLELDIGAIRAFEQEVNGLLKDTVLLISTYGGDPRYSTETAPVCQLWDSMADEWEQRQQEVRNSIEHLAVWQADLTHDGTDESIVLTEMAKGERYLLTVCNEEGTVIWMEEPSTFHVGWKGIYLYERDGKEYLMTWVPYGNTGIFDLQYQVFSLTEKGEQVVLVSDFFEFAATDEEQIKNVDVAALRKFENEVNALLSDAFLLIDTDNAKPVYSTEGNHITRLLSGQSEYVERMQRKIILAEAMRTAGMEIYTEQIVSVEEIDPDVGGTSRGVFVYRVQYRLSYNEDTRTCYVVMEHVWEDPDAGQTEQHTLLGILSEAELQRLYNREEILAQYDYDLYRAAALETYRKYYGI